MRTQPTRRDLGGDPVTDLVYFADCAIATYEELVMKRGSARSAIERARLIAEMMVASCSTHLHKDVDRGKLPWLARLQDRLASSRLHDRTLRGSAAGP